jgi:hypothetical protein
MSHLYLQVGGVQIFELLGIVKHQGTHLFPSRCGCRLFYIPRLHFFQALFFFLDLLGAKPSHVATVKPYEIRFAFIILAHFFSTQTAFLNDFNFTRNFSTALLIELNGLIQSTFGVIFKHLSFILCIIDCVHLSREVEHATLFQWVLSALRIIDGCQHLSSFVGILATS